MAGLPAPGDFEGWINLLARNSNRRRQARAHLLTAGPTALPAIRRGMHNPNPAVRRGCTSLLDQLVDDDSVPDLVAALDDDDLEVRARALHALACDQCTQGSCRPGEELFVPKAIAFVRHHPDADLRAKAIDALGRVYRRLNDDELRGEVADALLDAADRDPHPGVRNAAHMRTRRIRSLTALRANPRP